MADFEIINGKWHHVRKAASASVKPARRMALPNGRRSFAAAKVDNLTASFTGSFLSINEELRRDLRRIRARSRQLFMDNDHAKKFGSLIKNNVIGVKGIVLQARAKDKHGKLDQADNKLIEKGWKDWGKPQNCTVSGNLSWRAVQRLIVNSVARDGEVLVHLIDKPGTRFGFVVRVFSADYLDEQHNEILPTDNRVTMGVETDPDGLVVAYWLRDEIGSAYQNVHRVTEKRRIQAKDIIHLFIADWPDQRRGIPWMHTAIRRLNHLGGFEEAAVVAARIGASKMGFYTSPDGDYGNADDMVQGDADGKDSELTQHAEPGHFEELPEGVGFTSFDPKYPEGFYDPFTKAVLRGAASGLEVAYNSLSNDLENVNFSSIRAGLLEEREYYKLLQSWLIEHFHDRVYDRWLRAALTPKTGGAAVKLPFKLKDEKYSAIHWQPRGWPWVDPLKDSKANENNISIGTGTRSKVLAAEGEDFHDTVEQLAYEEQVAADYGVNVAPNQTTNINSIEELNDAKKTNSQND